MNKLLECSEDCAQTATMRAKVSCQRHANCAPWKYLTRGTGTVCPHSTCSHPWHRRANGRSTCGCLSGETTAVRILSVVFYHTATHTPHGLYFFLCPGAPAPPGAAAGAFTPVTPTGPGPPLAPGAPATPLMPRDPALPTAPGVPC